MKYQRLRPKSNRAAATLNNSMIVMKMRGISMSLSTERALNLLRVIEKAEEISQRELAERVEVSLGTANQTIRALVGDGILETNVVTTSKGKRGQTYNLTSIGKEQRKQLAKLRIEECERAILCFEMEINKLKQEI
jgi:DNA-binding MarR family transcriptional regulator